MTNTLAYVSKSVRTFTNNLANVTLSNQEGNFYFSPPSLFLLLGTIYQGASGNVAKVLKSVLNAVDPSTSLEDGVALVESLNPLGDVTFFQSSTIFVREITDVVSEFSKKADGFGSSVQQAFERKGHADRKINAWIEQQTKGKMTHIVGHQDYDEHTTGMLVTACYWKVDWLEKSSFYECKKDVFFVSEEEKVKCQMLRMVCHIKYSERKDIDSYVMEMPYKVADCSLMIFLPVTGTSLKNLESKLFKRDFGVIHEELNPCLAVVLLPKIKMENTFNFRDAFTRMGLGDLFNGCGQFPGIFETSEFNAKGFIHKVTIETGDQGSIVIEDTATDYVTKGYMSTTSSHNKIAFTANRPYIFCVCYHKSCFIPLVVGRVERP
ncbi:hypothetical protein Trydic_g13649 [Trypoxylus dichotomus]